MSQAASNQTNKQALEEFYNGFKDKFVAVQVSPEKLNTLLDEGKQDIVVVDVRSDEERKVSHLPGSISKAAFEANSAQYKSHMVVSYCTVGYRSGKYADGLLEKGFNSCNLAGSILGWAHEGYPVVSGEDPTQETKQIHTFFQKFAWVPEGYTAVTFSAPEAALVGAKSVLPRWLGGSGS